MYPIERNIQRNIQKKNIKKDCRCSITPCICSVELIIHTTWSTFNHSHQITTDTRLPLHETLRSILNIIWCTNRAECVETCGTDALCCVVHNSAACVVGSVTAVSLAWICSNKNVLIWRVQVLTMRIVYRKQRKWTQPTRRSCRLRCRSRRYRRHWGKSKNAFFKLTYIYRVSFSSDLRE